MNKANQDEISDVLNAVKAADERIRSIIRGAAAEFHDKLAADLKAIHKPSGFCIVKSEEVAPCAVFIVDENGKMLMTIIEQRFPLKNQNARQ